MSKNQLNDTETKTVFDDPVAYLADFGIEAELVAETVLATAA